MDNSSKCVAEVVFNILKPCNVFFVFPYRAQKEAEVTNGITGGDTPPEDDPGGGDDDINTDPINIQDENDDSFENTSNSRKLSPHRTSKVDPNNALKHSRSLNSSSSSGNISTGSISSTSNQRLDPTGGGVDVPGRKSYENLKQSRSYDRGGNRVGTEGANTAKYSSSPPLIFASASFTISTSSNSYVSATPSPGSLSQRQSSKRTKERERGESTSSIRSRGSRQTTVRTRAQSGGAEGYVPSSPSVGGSSVIRISSSAGVMGVAVGRTTPTNSPRKGRKEDGWKEVGRR